MKEKVEKELRQELDTVHQRVEKPQFQRHEHFNDKIKNWNLLVHRPILILGDSNLGRIPKCFDNRIQVDSYPGAKLGHALHILEKATHSNQVQKVILSFGLNDKKTDTEQARAQLEAIYKVGTEKFPNAQIVIPLINFSNVLPTRERKTLIEINLAISRLPHLPKLPTAKFQTVTDNVHWCPATAKSILTHWRNKVRF